MAKKTGTTRKIAKQDESYGDVLSSMVELLEAARRLSSRAVNSVMTATYWEMGRRIVELDQAGEGRAEYGEQLIKKLAADLSKRFGRGFAWPNLYRMRRFYAAYPKILSTPLTKLSSAEIDKKLSTALTKSQSIGANGLSTVLALADQFPLSWSQYLLLIAVEDEQARRFYEEEAHRGGWTVKQLKRQIDSQFYERTLLSKNQATMLRKGSTPTPEDAVSPESEIKDPLVLEFLDLKDEYSENDLEDALIHKLEAFLLELGSDFAFVGRQKRLRIGDEWYRIDLLFFHRGLKCLVVIDLKIGKFTHADAGQMHMYLNYAAEHWTRNGENPPVGLILCARNDESVARYALDNLPNKVMAREYKLALPNEQLLIDELQRTQRFLANRKLATDN